MTPPVSTLKADLHTPLADDDPRAIFAHAVGLGSAVIGRVGNYQLNNQTPCTEFDVRSLLDHMVMGLRRVSALGRGDDPFGPAVLAPPDADFRAADFRAADFRAAWSEAAHEVEVAWTDDEVLSRTMRLPWAEQPGAAMLTSYLNEVTVHTWDLAEATGQRPAWDQRIVSLAFDSIRFMAPHNRAAMFASIMAEMPPGLAPPGLAPAGDPFADAVDVHDDAPLIDRLVAWNGRRP